MDASIALIAIRRSRLDGLASALVGKSPNCAINSTTMNAATIVRMVPSTKARMCSPIVENPNRQPNFFSNSLVCFQPARFFDNVPQLRKKVFFLRRREWHWGVDRRNAHNGAIQIVKRFFVDDCGNLPSNAAGARVFMQD